MSRSSKLNVQSVRGARSTGGAASGHNADLPDIRACASKASYCMSDGHQEKGGVGSWAATTEFSTAFSFSFQLDETAVGVTDTSVDPESGVRFASRSGQ